MNKRIQKLNEAYNNIQDSLKIISFNIKRKGDIDTFLWRIEKALKELNREVLKQLKEENLDEEFKRITKEF